MAKSYKSREGKIVILRCLGEYKEGVVVGCERNIGLTIMSPDKKRYLLCLRHPRTFKTIKGATAKQIDKLFQKMIEMIDNGTMDIVELRKVAPTSPSHSVGPDTCAFT